MLDLEVQCFANVWLFQAEEMDIGESLVVWTLEKKRSAKDKQK